VVFPYILVGAGLFADKIQLSGMMQTASPFPALQQAGVVFRHGIALWRNGAQ